MSGFGKIAVMGAGAVGCYYGAMLARAGHQVVLIGRDAHVQAMNRDGLRLQTAAFDERMSVQAGTGPELLAGAGLVLFCVKSTDTEEAARQMLPHLSPDALVLSMQNGVDNAARLREVLPCGVAAAVVYVASEMAGPGHVKHNGRGELVIEPAPRSGEAAAVFNAAGVPTEVSDNVLGALWFKLVMNCCYNALSAIGQIPYEPLSRSEGVAAVMRDVTDECLAVARADGISIPGDVHEAVRHIAASMPEQMSSTAQDVRRGKPSEIDHLNGYVVRRGDALGVPAPANRVLHAVVRMIESQRAASRP